MKVRRIDFSPDEWLAGTLQLSEFDRGIYITICALIYSRGERIGEELLRRHCRAHGNAISAALSRLENARKIVRNGSEIGQKRCENELETAQKRSENGKENASKRWNNNGLDNGTPYAPGNANHQPSTTNHQRGRARARGNDFFEGRKEQDEPDTFGPPPHPLTDQERDEILRSFDS